MLRAQQNKPRENPEYHRLQEFIIIIKKRRELLVENNTSNDLVEYADICIATVKEPTEDTCKHRLYGIQETNGASKSLKKVRWTHTLDKKG